MPLPVRTGNPVSAAQLASMRSTTTATLPDTCTISRVTRTSDGAGGEADSLTPIATLPCRVWPTGRGVQAIEEAVATRLQGRTAIMVTLPHTAVVLASDLIQRQGDTDTLEVVGDVSARTWRTETRLICARVT